MEEFCELYFENAMLFYPRKNIYVTLLVPYFSLERILKLLDVYLMIEISLIKAVVVDIINRLSLYASFLVINDVSLCKGLICVLRIDDGSLIV